MHEARRRVVRIHGIGSNEHFIIRSCWHTGPSHRFDVRIYCKSLSSRDRSRPIIFHRTKPDPCSSHSGPATSTSIARDPSRLGEPLARCRNLLRFHPRIQASGRIRGEWVKQEVIAYLEGSCIVKTCMLRLELTLISPAVID